MKKLSKLLSYSLAAILTVGLFTACEPDPADIENPSISLSQADGYIYQDTILGKGEIFTVKLTATPGTNDLNLLTINENDTKLSLDRIISGINSNPALSLGADATGFTKDIEIMAQESGSSKYSFHIEDTEGNQESVEFIVTDVLTGLDSIAGDLKVYNIDGPLNGSIDLSIPAVVPRYTPGTNIFNPDVDIQDLGINLNLPLESNWIQKIRSMNVCELYKPAEGLVYEAIIWKEDLKTAVEAGELISQSDKLEQGDIYLAKSPSTVGETMDYFMIRVDEIYVEKTNNEDYYIFTVKQALNM